MSMIGRLFYVALGLFIGWVVFGHPDIANEAWERGRPLAEQFVSVITDLADRLL